MRRFVLFAVFLLACDDKGTIKIDGWTPTTTPDGKPGAIVQCYWGNDDCYKRLGKACPNGYTVIKEEINWKMAECK